jgi:hypothetical protein
MRRVLALVALVAAAGCTGGGSKDATPRPTTPPTQLNAEYICRRYVPGPLVSSEATTVADFRKTTIGSQGPAQLHRFPTLPGSTAAAWCWTGKPGAYSVYEVASDGQVQQVVSNINGVAPADARGAPFIP